MFADEVLRARKVEAMMAAKRSRHVQGGKVVVKFFWWPLIISLAISVILTIVLNVAL